MRVRVRSGGEDEGQEERGELTFSHARCLLMRVMAVYTKGGLIVPSSARCVPRLSNADYCIVRMKSSNECRVEGRQYARSSSVGSVSSPGPRLPYKERQENQSRPFSLHELDCEEDRGQHAMSSSVLRSSGLRALSLHISSSLLAHDSSSLLAHVSDSLLALFTKF